MTEQAPSPQQTHRRRWSPRRFTLRALLLLVTVVACGAGYVRWRMDQIRAQWREEQVVLRQLNEDPTVGSYRVWLEPVGPNWLRRVYPDDPTWHQIVRMSIDIDVVRDGDYIEQIQRLPNLAQVELRGSSDKILSLQKEFENAHSHTWEEAREARLLKGQEIDLARGRLEVLQMKTISTLRDRSILVTVRFHPMHFETYNPKLQQVFIDSKIGGKTANDELRSLWKLQEFVE